jgi:hypothetical protein
VTLDLRPLRSHQTVDLARGSDGHFLQFRDCGQTQGPGVYCDVSPAEAPDTSAEIAAGRKVTMDDGADGGELTLTGTVAQRLPDGVDPGGIGGVAAWCEDFPVPFGAATLTEA